MKVTVSVPESLWTAAQAASPGLNPSHLVQEALTALVAESEDSDKRAHRHSEGEILANLVSISAHDSQGRVAFAPHYLQWIAEELIES